MRPQRLEFTAIGSYPGTVVVDFDALAPYGLFHIHGPTGSGKSSLLDALCFALYGTVPAPRSTDRLRSDHAQAATEASSCLNFSAQGADYQILRKPAQLRPKKRGAGTTKTWPEAALLRKDGLNWVPVSDDVREVDAKMLQLIGLNDKQFMQVVVLPQGAFAEALRASAEDREKLLRTLFHTERFETYTERMKVRADAAKADYQSHEQDLHHRLTRVQTMVDALGLAADEEPSFTGEPDDVQRSIAAVARAKQKLVEQSDLLTAHRTECETAGTELQQVLVQAEHWQRRVGALNRLASLDAEADQMAELQSELHRAELVAPLFPLLESMHDAQQLQDTAAATQSSVIVELQDHAFTLGWASELQQAIHWLAEDPTSDALAITKQLVRDRASRMQLLSAAATSIQAQRRSVDVLSHERALAVAAQTEALAEFNQAKAALENFASEAASYEAPSQQLPRLESALVQIEGQYAAAVQLTKTKERVQKGQVALIEAEHKANEAQRLHLELFEKRLQAIAGELATSLSDGDPCKVCGSVEHPMPAGLDGVVGEVELQEAQALAEQARQYASTVRQKLDAVEKELNVLLVQAGVLADEPDFGASAVAAARHEREEASLARRALSHAADKLHQLDQAMVVARTSQEEAATHLASLQARANAAQASLDELLKEHGELEPSEIQAHDSQIRVVSDAVDVLQGAMDRHSHLTEQTAIATRRFQDALAGSSLALTAEDVLSDARSTAHVQILRETLERWRSARALAQHTLDDDAVKAVLTAPDVQEAQTKSSLAAAQLDTSVALVSRLEDQVKEFESSVASLNERILGLEPLREERDRLVTLWELCDGRQSNAMRMSLERYVLAAYLEEVADAASLRLQMMSSGRYRLRHSDAVAKRKAASGLGLLVSDAYTGVEREVSTLSGGETFLASLALALGLADIVQQHAGGVAIEALFVDEGFGSLDPDTLDLAMAELDRLREGGRLVGVISHVGALRERIPVGIEVVKEARGSTIRVTGVEEVA